MTIISNLSVIVACDDAGGIGRNNELFCHIPEDLKWFKANTLNKTVIMGSNTFRSIQKYTKNKLLPGREHVVLGKNISPDVEGVHYHKEIDSILALVEQNPDKEYMVIGGGQVYNLFLPHTNRLYLTRIAGEHDCDAFIDLSLYNGDMTAAHYEQVDKKETSEFDYHFRTYTIKPKVEAQSTPTPASSLVKAPGI